MPVPLKGDRSFLLFGITTQQGIWDSLVWNWVIRTMIKYIIIEQIKYQLFETFIGQRIQAKATAFPVGLGIPSCAADAASCSCSSGRRRGRGSWDWVSADGRYFLVWGVTCSWYCGRDKPNINQNKPKQCSALGVFLSCYHPSSKATWWSTFSMIDRFADYE